MRRIYESEALHRDDDEPHAPRERRRSTRPQSFRSLPAGSLTGSLLPQWLGRRAVSVDVSTPGETFEVGEVVPFRVTMKNTAPFPVTIVTASKRQWQWEVDGHPEASHVALPEPPEGRGALAFGRGERKQFDRQWWGRFRVSDSEWESAPSGEYTLGARVSVPGESTSDLVGRTSVRLQR